MDYWNENPRSSWKMRLEWGSGCVKEFGGGDDLGDQELCDGANDAQHTAN